MAAAHASELVTELQTEYERSRAFLSALEQSLKESRVCEDKREATADGSELDAADAEAPVTCDAPAPPKESGSLKGKLARFFSRKESKSSSSSKVVVVDPTAANDANVSSVQGLRRASVVALGDHLVHPDSFSVHSSGNPQLTNRAQSFVTRSGNSLAAMPAPQPSRTSTVRRATSFRVAPAASASQVAPEAVPPYPAAAAAITAASSGQLSLPAVDLRRSESRGVTSTGSGTGGGTSGASLFRKLQQLHAPISECGDGGEKLSGGSSGNGALLAPSSAAAAACGLLPELLQQLPAAGSLPAGGAFPNAQRARSLQQLQSSFRRRSATTLDAVGFQAVGAISAAGPLQQYSRSQLLTAATAAAGDCSSTSGANSTVLAAAAGSNSPRARRGLQHRPPSSLRSQSFRYFGSSANSNAPAASFMPGAPAAPMHINEHADLAPEHDSDEEVDDSVFGGGIEAALPTRRIASTGPAASLMTSLLRRGDLKTAAAAWAPPTAGASGGGTSPAASSGSTALVPTPPPLGSLGLLGPQPLLPGLLSAAAAAASGSQHMSQHRRKPLRAASTTCVMGPSLHGLSSAAACNN
ncbi:hypothetical protein HXX76_002408 [Chlamydomonas incerta]|uniref:Uncharacterized protein n=1 Tax=Chlamydomonas incerta TaxID=51695 RepID=A0A835TEN1_CHLIN|nr:hypothetical protein HXX76_002408 [Chlamydomonas incerta]|eukprot:KAG2442322.1 hypothetical protein HXX76_002408 [Chlamydomonas incerta]